MNGDSSSVYRKPVNNLGPESDDTGDENVDDEDPSPGKGVKDSINDFEIPKMQPG